MSVGSEVFCGKKKLQWKNKTIGLPENRSFLRLFSSMVLLNFSMKSEATFVSKKLLQTCLFLQRKLE